MMENASGSRAAPGKTRLPLEGIRVLDLGVVLAGPNAVTLLADWGAEVVRAEPLQVYQVSTRGRHARPPQALIDANRNYLFAYPDFNPGQRPWNRWPHFQAHGRNKLGMTVDLRKPEGLQVILKLASLCDIVIENNVPETLDNLGLTYERFRRARPDIVYLRMPAYGLHGPYSNYRSFGAHLEGFAGHTWIRGYPDTDATLTEDIFFGDACAAATAAFAAAIAIHQQRRTGRGQEIDLAQAESLVPFFGELLLDVQMNGRIAGPQGNDLYGMAPHNTYRCQGEDRWVAIAVRDDAAWQGMVRAMGTPAWALEPRFSTQKGRHAARQELDRLVEGWTSQHEGRWIMETLQACGVAAGIVSDEQDAYADSHLNARGFFEEITHSESGTHRYPGIIWKMARTPNAIRTPPVKLGEHNEPIYKELLGLSDGEFAALERAGHIGTEYPPHIK